MITTDLFAPAYHLSFHFSLSPGIEVSLSIILDWCCGYQLLWIAIFYSRFICLFPIYPHTSDSFCYVLIFPFTFSFFFPFPFSRLRDRTSRWSTSNEPPIVLFPLPNGPLPSDWIQADLFIPSLGVLRPGDQYQLIFSAYSHFPGVFFFPSVSCSNTWYSFFSHFHPPTHHPHVAADIAAPKRPPFVFLSFRRGHRISQELPLSQPTPLRLPHARH